MRMGVGKCLAAAALLLAGLAAPCAAQEADFAFGGRGEDALYEAVAAGDGLFAVGTTASADGDLASRTRSGETGWAIRIGADGVRQWDFCSAKSGMSRMTAPHAYRGGGYSLVLTDEAGQRGEWILLTERGRQQSRTAIPGADSLCPQGKPAQIVRMTASSGETGPYLAVTLLHAGSGELCCAALYPDGGVRACGEFYGDADGVTCPLEDEGAVLHLGADLGALRMTALKPGAQIRTAVIPLEDSGMGLARVTDALVGEDGSVVLCAQAVASDQKSAGLLMRVNAEGETLFEAYLPRESAPSLLTHTDTGYAVYGAQTQEILFFDEDGGALGASSAPQAVCDLAQGEGGVLALSHLPERGKRQAAFTLIAQPDSQPEVPAEPEAEPEPAYSAAANLALSEGHLACSAVEGGVSVAYVDGAGRTLWQTRTLIHTAADRLIWESAEITADGDILLCGRYETDTRSGLLTQGAQALLSADGVLRQIRLAP